MEHTVVCSFPCIRVCIGIAYCTWEVIDVFCCFFFGVGRLISLMAERQPLGGLSEKDILRVFCDVCEAISQFHHRQPPIIHRDIKVHWYTLITCL